MAQMGQPQPQYAPMAVGQPQNGQWTAGLFSCMDNTGLCCDVCWCGYCHMARQVAAINDRRINDPNWVVCCALFVVTYFTGIAPCLLNWWMRDKMRTEFGIDGGAAGDCCASCFCTCCASIQQHRELKQRGLNPGVCLCGGSDGPQAVQAQPQYGQPVPQQQYGAPPPQQFGAQPGKHE
eukprot:TRINITY_DN1721_c10_g1_i1.p2 TRINITY_DN1721_c10_g1~~TRINITY_DN1721_c10_g1_i1.p2  ORF type:complete len:179 (+),score=66.94 TRINITY_DN1721_c10_g1_i1:92-628(+)